MWGCGKRRSLSRTGVQNATARRKERLVRSECTWRQRRCRQYLLNGRAPGKRLASEAHSSCVTSAHTANLTSRLPNQIGPIDWAMVPQTEVDPMTNGDWVSPYQSIRHDDQYHTLRQIVEGRTTPVEPFLPSKRLSSLRSRQGKVVHDILESLETGQVPLLYFSRHLEMQDSVECITIFSRTGVRTNTHR